MNKKLLAAFAVVVVGLVVVLVIKSRSSSPAPVSAATKPAAERTVPPPLEPSTASPARPQLPAETRRRVETAMGGSPEYVRDDGAVIRDHRVGGGNPLLENATPGPAGVRKMDAESIMAVRGALRPIMRECSEIDGLDLGAKGQLQTVVKVTVVGGVLTVDSAEAQTAEIGNPQPLIDCVKTKARELKIKVPGEDISGYPLTMPFRIHQKQSR